jgi:hypothetical protein
MKKITATAGVAALSVLGGTSVHAQGYPLAPQLSQQELSKPWSISAALRGFYDDNSTATASALKDDSFGFEITPGVSLNLPLDQTYIGLSYVYSLRYYEGRSNGKEDQAHLFNAKLNHMFTERYKVDVLEQFVVSQEPSVLDAGTPLRSDGDNIRNRGSIDFTAGLTPTVSAVIGYANTYVNYDQDGFPSSYSGLLDRLENLFSLTARCQFLPSTAGLLGYQFGTVHFTSDDGLANPLPPPAVLASDTRDSYSHYGFVGVDHNFTQELQGSLRLGVQYTEYPDAPTSIPGVEPCPPIWTWPEAGPTTPAPTSSWVCAISAARPTWPPSSAATCRMPRRRPATSPSTTRSPRTLPPICSARSSMPALMAPPRGIPLNLSFWWD